MATYLDELVQKIVTKADLRGFDDLDRKQKRAIKSNDLLGKSFRRAFGVFFGIQGIKSVIQTTRDFDLLKSSIEGITKSTEDWEYLRSEANRTGTSFKSLAQAYKNFYSAANMSGFNKNQIQSMFSDVLTAGRGAGISQQQMDRALLAMEQMLSKGKVSMEELRRQLGNAMPGAFEIAAKSMGVTTEQLNELVKKGLDARVLLPKLAREMRNYYLEAYYKNIHTLDAELIRLNNAWLDFQANILHGEAGEALAQLVRDITNILKSNELLKFVKLFGQGLALIINNLKTILLLFGINKIMQYVNSFIILHNAILKIATTTNNASKATRLLAIGYARLTNKNIIAGIRALTKGLWLMCIPLLKIGFILAGLVSWFLILQDIWLTFADEDADTITRRYMNTQEMKKNMKINAIKPLTADEKDKVVSSYRQQGLQPTFKSNKDGTYEFLDVQPIKTIPAATISMPTNSTSQKNDTKNISYNPTIYINGSNLTESQVRGIFAEENEKFLTLMV